MAVNFVSFAGIITHEAASHWGLQVRGRTCKLPFFMSCVWGGRGGGVREDDAILLAVAWVYSPPYLGGTVLVFLFSFGDAF